MKRWFYILILFSIFSCGSSDEDLEAEQICDCYELKLDPLYNRYFKTERKEPYTGKCQMFHPNGQVQMIKNLNEGKIHGMVYTYYENGQLEFEREYDMNFQLGDEFYYNVQGKLIHHKIFNRSHLKEVVEYHPENE